MRLASRLGVGQTWRVDATGLLSDLVGDDCRFVVVGSTARAWCGDRQVPADLDLVLADEQENVDRVMAVLARAGGRLTSAGGVRLDRPRVAGHDLWRVVTMHGPVDVIIRFPDGSGYDEFASTSVDTDVPDVGTVRMNPGDGR